MWEQYDKWVEEQFNSLQQDNFTSIVVVKENNRIINRQLKRQIRRYGN
jgi:hypothetical protein